MAQMRAKLQSEAGRSLYTMRKAIVEPVFGQIKEVRGFRRFSFRGLSAVSREWKMVCLTHNLLKLFRCGGWAQTRTGTRKVVSGSGVGAPSCLSSLVLRRSWLLTVFARAVVWLSRPSRRLGFVY